MKLDRDDQIDADSDLGRPIECALERLQTPEIVGEVDNPVLEAIRRLWWRGFDRLCYFFVLVRLSIRNPLWYAVRWPRRWPQTR